MAGEGPQLGPGRGGPVVAGGGDGVPAPEFGGAVLEADHDVRQVRFRRQRPPEFLRGKWRYSLYSRVKHQFVP